MNRFDPIWPEEGEREARQPEQPLMRYPDGSLKQLDAREGELNRSHKWFGHTNFVSDCLSCRWENAI